MACSGLCLAALDQQQAVLPEADDEEGAGDEARSGAADATRPLNGESGQATATQRSVLPFVRRPGGPKAPVGGVTKQPAPPGA